eukprot:jgi/Chlat1/4762/Chrsp308S00826
MDAEASGGGGGGGVGHPDLLAKPGLTKKQCDIVVDRALRDPFVKFMIEGLAKAGCRVDRRFFSCEESNEQVTGGFKPSEGVVVFHNNVATQSEVNQLLTHELIHAFDHCRARNVNWPDCYHHACTEIRASNLSKECHWHKEFERGNYRLKGQHQACVRRRAQLSTSMNPYCTGEQAKEAVDAMWTTCIADTAPFDRTP